MTAATVFAPELREAVEREGQGWLLAFPEGMLRGFPLAEEFIVPDTEVDVPAWLFPAVPTEGALRRRDVAAGPRAEGEALSGPWLFVWRHARR